MATLKAKATSATSVVLSPAEKTTVVALSTQRQRLMQEANRQLAELDAAMKDIQALYAQKYKLVDGELRIRQEGEHLILEIVEKQGTEDGEPDGNPE